MAKESTSKRITAVRDAQRGFWNFLTHAESAKRRKEPGALDFSLGNPHEIPPAGYAETLKKWTFSSTRFRLGEVSDAPSAPSQDPEPGCRITLSIKF